MGSVSFAKRVKEEGISPNYSYAEYDGEVIFDGACYGQLHEVCEENGWGVQNLSVYHKMGKDFRQELYDFFMSDKMFGKVFLDTSLEKGLEQGWDLDTKQPYQLVLGAMIALRYSFNVQTYGSFDKFREVGASVAEAYLLGSIVAVSNSRLDVRNHISDHCVVNFFGVDFVQWTNNPTPTTTTSVSTFVQAYFEEDDDGIEVNNVWGMWPAGRFFDCLVKIFDSKLSRREGKSVFGRASSKYAPNTPENLKIILEELRKGVSL